MKIDVTQQLINDNIYGDVIDVQPKATIMVGVSGSGKTTKVAEMMETARDTVVINSDELATYKGRKTFLDSLNLKDLTPDLVEQLSSTRKDSFLKKTTEFIHLALAMICATGRDLILDRTNMSKNERQKFIHKLLQCGYEVNCEYMEITATEAITRIRNRGDHLTLKPQHAVVAVRSQLERLDPPSILEGFEKVVVNQQ